MSHAFHINPARLEVTEAFLASLVLAVRDFWTEVRDLTPHAGWLEVIPCDDDDLRARVIAHGFFAQFAEPATVTLGDLDVALTTFLNHGDSAARAMIFRMVVEGDPGVCLRERLAQLFNVAAYGRPVIERQ